MILLRETPERNSWLLEPGEAPVIEAGCTLMLDVETTGAGKSEALYAYSSEASLAGYSFTMDGANAFYVPIRHRDCQLNWTSKNALQLILDLFDSASIWCNHNIKFDAHFIAESLRREGMEKSKWLFTGRWYDTMVMSRIIDSDRFTSGLKELVKEFFGADTSSETRIKQWLRDMGSKDYGDIPADMLGEYACDDVFYVCDLRAKFESEMPDKCRGVQETEILLTPVLFDMERAGMRVDYEAMQKAHLECLRSTIMKSDRIEKLTGLEFTNSPKSLFEILCVQLGLPVLARTDIGNPSFDSDALELYLGHPDVVTNPEVLEVVELIMDYREDSTFLSLFIEGFKKFITPTNTLLHPDYNQVVRTGRLSCRRPNAQQQNKRSKALILPDEGGAFLSCDASQIEYRLIVDYMEDEASIRAYNEDPLTDFHTWASQLCETDRSTAKSMNFAISFGAGEKRALTMLMANKSIIASVGARVDDLITRGLLKPEERLDRFKALVHDHAKHVYSTYHKKFPNLKVMSRTAMTVALARGYVFNRYGRRRYLPSRACYKAFNSVIQGCAADFIKNRMVACAHRYNQSLQDAGIELRIDVHDELVFHGEKSTLLQYEPVIVKLLETQEPIKFRVPLIWNSGVSDVNWADALVVADTNHKARIQQVTNARTQEASN